MRVHWCVKAKVKVKVQRYPQRSCYNSTVGNEKPKKKKKKKELYRQSVLRGLREIETEKKDTVGMKLWVWIHVSGGTSNVDY